MLHSGTYTTIFVSLPYISNFFWYVSILYSVSTIWTWLSLIKKNGTTHVWAPQPARYCSVKRNGNVYRHILVSGIEEVEPSIWYSVTRCLPTLVRRLFFTTGYTFCWQPQISNGRKHQQTKTEGCLHCRGSYVGWSRNLPEDAVLASLATLLLEFSLIYTYRVQVAVPSTQGRVQHPIYAPTIQPQIR